MFTPSVLANKRIVLLSRGQWHNSVMVTVQEDGFPEGLSSWPMDEPLYPACQLKLPWNIPSFAQLTWWRQGTQCPSKGTCAWVGELTARRNQGVSLVQTIVNIHAHCGWRIWTVSGMTRVLLFSHDNVRWTSYIVCMLRRWLGSRLRFQHANAIQLMHVPL